MNELSLATLKSGLIDPRVLTQVRGWGVPVPEVSPAEVTKLQDITAALEYALQEEDLVVVKVTDLDLVGRYLATQTPGILTLVQEQTREEVHIALLFGRSMQDIILPYRGDSIEDLLTADSSSLRWLEGEMWTSVRFRSAKPIYYNGVQAFVLCEVRP